MKYNSEFIYYTLERFLSGERILIIARDLKISSSIIDIWRKKYLGLNLQEIENIIKINAIKSLPPKKRGAELKEGQKFGKLIAINEVKDKKGYWEFKCECGNIHKVKPTNVINGYTRSCGCLRKEYSKKTYIANWLKNKQEKKSFY